MGVQNSMLYRSLYFLIDYLPLNHDNNLRVSFLCRRTKSEPSAGRGLGFSEWQITECHRLSMSASLIGRLGSSTFRLSTTAVSMSLTGSCSCFSSESAPRPFHYGIRGRGGTICYAALPSD